MKIICIGRNYLEHIKELKNEVPDDPIIFIKPDTAILKNNAPFYFPKISNDIHYEAELVVRINREGKNIEEKFASKYYDEIGVGIDFTARDLQKKATERGLPWTLAKGFNGSAPVSVFVPKTKYKDLNNLSFSLKQNGVLKQNGNTAQMVTSIDKMIAYVSNFMTLKNGDLLFTGTPSGVGPIAIGDTLEVFIEEESLLLCEVK